MFNELTVLPIAAVRVVSGNSGQARSVSADAQAVPKSGVEALPAPNPRLQLDPVLGLVVIEFRNDAGDVTTSIPSEHQIQAYQRWQTTHFGPVPSGMDATPKPDEATAPGDAVSAKPDNARTDALPITSR
jgi:hypothetical protein